MSGRQIFDSWDEAFAQARRYLDDGRLTAIAMAPFASEGQPITAMHLAEAANGDLAKALVMYELLAKQQYAGKSPIQLAHYRSNYAWQGELIEGWVLAMFYPD